MNVVDPPHIAIGKSLQREWYARKRLADAATMLRATEAQTSAVESELKSLSYSGRTVGGYIKAALEAADIDVGRLNYLAGRFTEYRSANVVKRIQMGNPSKELELEADRLIGLWYGYVRSLRKAVEVAGRDSIVGPESQRGYFESIAADKTLCPDEAHGYIGQLIAEPARAAGYSRLPHILWQIECFQGREWSRLPYQAHGHVGTYFASGSDGLPYAMAVDGVRGVVIDQMARAFPRQLIVTWIDPVGRGSSAGPLLELLELDRELLDGKVWSEPDEVATALRRLTDRISYVEQRCLKDRFDSLDEYNAQAGALAEPARVLVVTGYPENFNEDSARRLAQIAAAGGRCGISVHVVTREHVGRTAAIAERNHFPWLSGFRNGDLPVWVHGVAGSNALLTVVGYNGVPHAPAFLGAGGDGEYVFAPAALLSPDPGVARAIVEGYAAASAAASDVRVDADELTLSESEAAQSTMGEVRLPLGVMGRGDRLDLVLGRGLLQNVLVGGLPGSGKSTLFHTLITSAVRRYEPDELELYLLDFKQGVEFQSYASGELPHARVVAVQSEREFGLSVLRGLKAEIDHRAELFRGPQGAGADSLADYRARTGQKLPRVLAVIDEFQVLFSHEDAIAHECGRLLDHLVRQGRAFGLHAILGTQTLRGYGSLAELRSTFDQIAIRIVLKTSEADSRLFLSEGNLAGARLSRPGEAIFNDDAGRTESNREFQVALSSDESRDGAIEVARITADESGFTRRPIVFDGTRPISVFDDATVAGLVAGRTIVDPRVLRLHLGLPVSLDGAGAVELHRRPESNLLLIGKDPDVTLGSLAVGLTTAVIAAANGPHISVVDCLGLDEDGGQLLQESTAYLFDTVYVRRPKLVATLERELNEVRRRIQQDLYREQRRSLVVNALQRARELGDENSYDNPTRAALLELLRNGPDVGVHTVLIADSLDALVRRIGSEALGEFGSRMILQCSEESSRRLVGSEAAANLGAAYALIVEPGEARLAKIRPFPPPPDTWLESAILGVRQKEGT